LIRKANISDVKKIKKLIDAYSAQNKMLARSFNDLYEHLRDYYVYLDNGEIKGCCALHVVWEDLAEVKALAVAEDCCGKGVGKLLVEECIKEAKNLGIKKVFALTYVDKFFLKLGFVKISREELPHKVWGECIHCPKFPDCDEIAVLMTL
jgi:amino-acid N-acetyltransferase